MENDDDIGGVWHFNSHAHVERDLLFFGGSFCGSISTHTLTWSVTVAGGGSGQGTTISTHTLTWSVTRGKCEQIVKSHISTHTLTWSVTKYGHD